MHELDPIWCDRPTSRDMEALLAIEQQCFNVYYYDYYMLDRRDFEFYLQDPDYLLLVAEEGTRVVGYVLGEIDRMAPSAQRPTSTASPCCRRPRTGNRQPPAPSPSRRRSAAKAARG